MKSNTRKTGIMTPEHPSWGRFTRQLRRTLGCNLREQDDDVLFACDGSHERPKAMAILKGFAGVDVEASLRFFEEHGGHCDCEILWNVEANVAREIEEQVEAEIPYY